MHPAAPAWQAMLAAARRQHHEPLTTGKGVPAPPRPAPVPHPPMGNETRAGHYRTPGGGQPARTRLTPAQRRRLTHKDRARWRAQALSPHSPADTSRAGGDVCG